MIDGLKEEAHLLNLLKNVFLVEPNRVLIQSLQEVKQVPVENEMDKGLNLLLESVGQNRDQLDEYLEELAVEFATLFIGPRKPQAIPYASYYLSETKTLMTDVTIEVRKSYLSAGMVAQNLHSIPDDHIGTELEFLQFLAEKSATLFDEAKKEEAAQIFDIREAFFREHFSQWVPEFTEKVLESASSDFYRGAARMLSQLA